MWFRVTVQYHQRPESYSGVLYQWCAVSDRLAGLPQALQFSAEGPSQEVELLQRKLQDSVSKASSLNDQLSVKVSSAQQWKDLRIYRTLRPVVLNSWSWVARSLQSPTTYCTN